MNSNFEQIINVCSVHFSIDRHWNFIICRRQHISQYYSNNNDVITKKFNQKIIFSSSICCLTSYFFIFIVLGADCFFSSVTICDIPTRWNAFLSCKTVCVLVFLLLFNFIFRIYSRAFFISFCFFLFFNRMIIYVSQLWSQMNKSLNGTKVEKKKNMYEKMFVINISARFINMIGYTFFDNDSTIQ